MSALSELLNQANGGRLSARSLARSAQAAGFSLNHDTAARYLRGDHGRPDEATLLALSKVLRIPLGRLRTAASLPAEVTEPYRPPSESSRLNRRQRRAIDEIIRAMLETPRMDSVDVETGPAAKPAARTADKTGARTVADPPTARPAAAKAGTKVEDLAARRARRGASTAGSKPAKAPAARGNRSAARRGATEPPRH